MNVRKLLTAILTLSLKNHQEYFQGCVMSYMGTSGNSWATFWSIVTSNPSDYTGNSFCESCVSDFGGLIGKGLVYNWNVEVCEQPAG